MNLGVLDRKIINLVQSFPLTSQPYLELGLALGITEDEAIKRIGQLKTKGLIRQISPVLDAACLGYKSTLAAMRVKEANLDETERIISQHPGVSHGYEREHYFNIWFTLSLSNGSRIEDELEKIASLSGAEIFISLPTVKRFKIGAYFDMGGNGLESASASPICAADTALSQEDKLLVNELQQDLPLVSKPFAAMAAKLGLNENEFLERCRSLLKNGVMRRYGASINHHKAGFKGNAMTCWAVPSELVDVTGRELSSLRQVSHCYERKTNPHWKYNMFAMIHGHSREACRDVAGNVSERLGLKDSVLLFSTREFKKTRNKYLV